MDFSEGEVRHEHFFSEGENNAREKRERIVQEADVYIAHFEGAINQFFYPHEREAVINTYVWLESFGSDKAKEYFGSSLAEVEDWSGSTLANAAYHIEFARQRAEIAPQLETVIREFDGSLARLFVEKVRNTWPEVIDVFFRARKQRWEASKDERLRVLEEFLVDAIVAGQAAKAAAIFDPEEVGAVIVDNGKERSFADLPPIDPDDWKNEDILPSVGVKVRLQIPTADQHQEFEAFVADLNGIIGREDVDDQDYELPRELSALPNLEKEPRQVDLLDLYGATKVGDERRMSELVDRLAVRPLTETQRRFIMDALMMMTEVWGVAKEPTNSEVVKELRGRLKSVERLSPLPDSARDLTVYHKLFGRGRRLEDFTTVLHRRMIENVLAGAVSVIDAPNPDLQELGEIMVRTEFEARLLYTQVTDSQHGVPIFREFANWINAQHKEAVREGRQYPGEFYVGRDTQATLYPAVGAVRWGELSAKDRRELTVFVNVSRPLLKSLGYDSTDKRYQHEVARSVMLDWLKKEGVTERMMGIDGGYNGSGPDAVLKAFDPEITKEILDQQVRLVESHSPQRRFDPEALHAGVVSWMETLPKFTDRAEGLVKDEAGEYRQDDFGKYYVASKKRSPTERILAWTVQHAVWRELINHGPVVEKVGSAED